MITLWIYCVKIKWTIRSNLPVPFYFFNMAAVTLKIMYVSFITSLLDALYC